MPIAMPMPGDAFRCRSPIFYYGESASMLRRRYHYFEQASRQQIVRATMLYLIDFARAFTEFHIIMPRSDARRKVVGRYRPATTNPHQTRAQPRFQQKFGDPRAALPCNAQEAAEAEHHIHFVRQNIHVKRATRKSANVMRLCICACASV